MQSEMDLHVIEKLRKENAELKALIGKLLDDIEGHTLPNVWLNDNAQKARVLLGRK